MKDIFLFLFGFLLDTSKKLTHRITTVVITLLILYLVNNIFGFTYYYNSGKRIEQLKNISELLKDSSLSVAERTYLLNEKRYTIERKNIFQKTTGLFALHSKQDTTRKVIINKNNEPVVLRKQNFIAVFITSNLILIIFILLFPIAIIIDMVTGKADFWESLIMFVFMEGILLVISTAIANVVYNKVPTLFNHPVYNYVLYSLVNIALIFTAVKVALISSDDSRLVSLSIRQFKKKR